MTQYYSSYINFWRYYNIGILVFTTNAFDLKNINDKWGLFIVLEHGLLCFKIAFSAIVAEVPNTVAKGLIWGKRIADERL